jgi:hypothetical protein
MITAGEMSADRISGGTIKGVTININNGTFQVDSNGSVTIYSGNLYVFDPDWPVARVGYTGTFQGAEFINGILVGLP